MEWTVERRGEILLQAMVSDTFLSWLRSMTHDPLVAHLDPYRDTALDRIAQDRWLAALRSARAALERALREACEARARLARDPDVRAQILTRLVAQEARNDPRWTTAMELDALLELARESDAYVRVIGD